MRSRFLSDSRWAVLLFRDRFSVQKPLSRIQRSTLSRIQHTSNPHSFGGFELREGIDRMD